MRRAFPTRRVRNIAPARPINAMARLIRTLENLSHLCRTCAK
jgi:hypothetical protein